MANFNLCKAGYDSEGLDDPITVQRMAGLAKLRRSDTNFAKVRSGPYAILIVVSILRDYCMSGV